MLQEHQKQLLGKVNRMEGKEAKQMEQNLGVMVLVKVVLQEEKQIKKDLRETMVEQEGVLVKSVQQEEVKELLVVQDKLVQLLMMKKKVKQELQGMLVEKLKLEVQKDRVEVVVQQKEVQGVVQQE